VEPGRWIQVPRSAEAPFRIQASAVGSVQRRTRGSKRVEDPSHLVDRQRSASPDPKVPRPFRAAMKSWIQNAGGSRGSAWIAACRERVRPDGSSPIDPPPSNPSTIGACLVLSTIRLIEGQFCVIFLTKNASPQASPSSPLPLFCDLGFNLIHRDSGKGGTRQARS